MRADEAIQKDIIEELHWEPSLEPAQIGVSVTNGIVTLTGTVKSYLTRQLAEDVARRVKGVRGVAEDIEVRLSPGERKNDTEIAAAVADVLRWHTNIPEDKVRVLVEKGWVTLEGVLDWPYQKEAAVHAIQDMAGVEGISDRITLKPKAIAADVKEQICRAISRYAGVAAEHIQVEAIGRMILLKGIARSWKERKVIERAAWSAPGVAEVQNEIRVEPEENVADEDTGMQVI